MDKLQNPVPINVRPMLKSFIENQKLVLKRKLGKFMAVSEVITYYLEGNEEFIRDFKRFTEEDK